MVSSLIESREIQVIEFPRISLEEWMENKPYSDLVGV